jgi:hypothetical protein
MNRIPWTAGTCSLQCSQRSVGFRPIPKGLYPPAQGCRVGEATLGAMPELISTPTGLHPSDHLAPTPLGSRPFPCGFPEIARAPHPWALSRNPLGIKTFVPRLPAPSKIGSPNVGRSAS